MNDVCSALVHRVASYDAPILLHLAPSAVLELHEELPEHLLERCLAILEEVHDHVVGLFLSPQAFFVYGSGGVAALEAVYEAAEELGFFIVTDIGSLRFDAEIAAVHRSFCASDSLFYSDAICVSCRDFVLQKKLQQVCPDTICFFHRPTDYDVIYCDRLHDDIRKQHPAAFLLADWEELPSHHLRRADGTGVLHICRTIPEHIWSDDYRRDTLRQIVIDFAKHVLSLGA